MVNPVMANTLESIVDDRHVVICCGTGGVGKTTTAAAIALEAARRGRRACVVTIDPARRLANALGLEALSNSATAIDHERWDPERASTGALFALMLDPKHTFDGLVTRYAETTEQAERILQNRFYRNISGALGGTQEYMAMEKLHELYSEGSFDIVVVDTPPTRHALDFVDAPARLLRLFDNRLFRIMMMPTRASMKVAGVALQTLLRTMSRVVGREVVDDVIAFFRAFEGMEAGFRERAAHVQALIADPKTAFVLVTTPRRDAVDEADYFARRLIELDLDVEALIVNRVQPTFITESLSAVVDRSTAAQGATAEAYRLLVDLETVAARERAEVGRVIERVPDTPKALVPLLASDVHDLTGLAVVASHMFGDPPSDAGSLADR
jgi:anion-transporting  ArsA/GET3 family ATPase